MQFFFSFLFKYLFSPRSGSLIRSVSIICIVAMAGSLASLIVVMSVMSGFGLSIRQRLLSKQPHLVIIGDKRVHSREEKSTHPPGDNGSDSSAVPFAESQAIADPPKKNPSKLLVDSVKTILKPQSKNIQSIRAFEKQDFIIKTKNGVFSGVVGRGYSPQYLKTFFAEENYNSKIFQEQNFDVEWDSSSQEDFAVKEKAPFENTKIYMGSSLAHRLNVFEGDSVFLVPVESLLLPPGEIPSYQSVKIHSLIYSGHSSIQAKDVVYEIGSLPKTASLSYGVEVFLNDPENAETYQSFLKDRGFQVETWSERHSSLFFALKIEKLIMILFLCLASLIASFSLSSMISLLIAQKKRDIGILMIMGWPLRKVRQLFIRLSFALSLMGIVSGLLLGYLICLILQHNPVNILPPIYYDRSFPVEMSVELFLGVGFWALALSYVAGVFPVYSHTLSSPTALIKKR